MSILNALAVLVDGAHAVGAVPLDVPSLGVQYYTSNLHKWACTPKGAAFLWVERSQQAAISPLVTSHGYAKVRLSYSHYNWHLVSLSTTQGAAPGLSAVAHMQSIPTQPHTNTAAITTPRLNALGKAMYWAYMHSCEQACCIFVSVL